MQNSVLTAVQSLMSNTFNRIEFSIRLYFLNFKKTSVYFLRFYIYNIIELSFSINY